jgi:galactose-1-phosphate uridylyltransferase
MFDRVSEKVRFYSPLKGFEEDFQDIEYRKDPLTGKWSRVNIQRSKRVKEGEGEFECSDLIKISRKNCFFCPENIELSTPKFRSDLISGGRFTRGETHVFPNLYPFARHHAVATITEEHFLRTGEFEESQIEDTILASLDFCRSVYTKDPAAKYATFNWNHLFPSGASILHPHVQITMDSRPTYMTENVLNASKAYMEKNNRIYWNDLVSEEKKKAKRFIASSDGIIYLASFSPFGNNEVLIIFEEIAAFTELDDDEVASLSKGIINILKGYEELGVESFNLTTYSGPIEDSSPGMNLHMRIVSRPSPRPYYTSDVGFMEGLHFERVVETLPEDVATIMKKYFQSH